MPDIANSFSKGFGLTDNLMQQILGRNQLKQKAAHEKEALEQAEKHFQLNYGLSKAAAARAAQAASDAHKKMDPLYEINQYKALENFIKGQAGQQTGGQIPSEQHAPVPTQEAGQGLGMFSPEGMQEAQQTTPVPASAVGGNANSGGQNNTSGIDMELLKNNPLLRGFFKKHFGVDPLGSSKENAYTGPAREALDLSRLKKQFGENSEEYQTAKALEHAKTQQHEDLSAIRARQLNGLKPGDTEIKDPNTGQTIGFKKQTTDKQKDAAKNTVLFNQLYPLVQLSAELSGPGAASKFHNAAKTYKTNPESRRIIDNLLIADKASTTSAVTESSRFNAGHTNQTFNRLVDTLKSEDIHKKLKKWIKEYEIPAEANIKAGKRWQEELNKAEKLANSRIPATMDYYFDPDKQFAAQQEQQSGGNNTTNSMDFSKMSDEELNAIAGGG